MFQASDHKTRSLIHVVFQSPASSVLSNFHILRKTLRGPAHLSVRIQPSFFMPPKCTRVYKIRNSSNNNKKGRGKSYRIKERARKKVLISALGEEDPFATSPSSGCELF